MKTTQESMEQTLASTDRPDWFYVGSKGFFFLAFVPPLLMIPSGTEESTEGILIAADRVPLYGWTALGLATLSGFFAALNQLRRARRSSDEAQHE